MRLANVSRIVKLLACVSLLATCTSAQEHPNVMPSTVRDQLHQGAPGAQSSPPSAASKAPANAPAANKPSAAAQAMPAAKNPAAGKPAAKAASASKPAASGKPGDAATAAKPSTAKADKKADAKAIDKTAAKSAEKDADKAPTSRRDPFDALLYKNRPGADTPENLPPGKAGLQVGTLRIDGIVRGSAGPIAIVSNPQQRVYFLKEGDKLYDGTVSHITLEAISFQEFGKDAFGKPVEHQVTRRLYPSPGESR